MSAILGGKRSPMRGNVFLCYGRCNDDGNSVHY